MNEYTFDEIKIGQKEVFETRITADMMDAFKNISGDTNPLHCDKEFANHQGFDDRVVYGMLTASMISTLAGVYLPGRYCLINTVNIAFTKPVYIGDKLKITGTVMEKNQKFQYIVVKFFIENQNHSKVCRGKLEAGVRK